MFEATELNRKNSRVEKGMRVLYLTMALVLIVPVLLVLGVLIEKGVPALSWEFLTEVPLKGMTAGGIFPALVGTVCAGGLSRCLASVPDRCRRRPLSFRVRAPTTG